MKYRYRLHPSDCALGENEQFYSNMEAKGWRLVNRGRNFSKFAPVEPSRARYRIEVCAPEPLETGSALSEGQLAVFEDCGWEFVTYQRMLHVFRAPEGSRAPEFYTDPRQQAETLKKLRRSAIGSCLYIVLYMCFYLIFYSYISDGPTQFYAQLYRYFITATSLYLLLAVIVLSTFYTSVRDVWLVTRTYRRMKQGIPLDHDPQKRHTLHHLFQRSFLALTLLCILLSGLQLLTTRKAPLPQEADGPYLLLRDLGHEGERTTFMDRDSKVTCTRSLLADYWDTVEYLDTGADHCWIYQDIYRLRDGRMAMGLARALLEAATFGGNFTPVQTEGLDAAWTTHGMEVVAVKGNMAAYITYLGGSYDNFDPQAICAALAEVWADTAD